MNENFHPIEPEADDLMDKVREFLPLGIGPTTGLSFTRRRYRLIHDMLHKANPFLVLFARCPKP